MATTETMQKLRGLFFVVGGILLLLYSLGFVQRLGSTLLLIVSLFLIISGFIESGYYHYFTGPKSKLPS
jgi:uncharacterized membrane protein